MTDTDIQRVLGRIEGKQDAVLEAMKDMKAKQVIDSTRIGSLERSRAGLWGSIITAKAFLASLAYIVFKG